MTNQNDRIAKLEAAIAELEEMVNAREIDLIHLRAELARLRPLAELYPLAWEECYRHRWPSDPETSDAKQFDKEQRKLIDAHDKARAKRGVGQ